MKLLALDTSTEACSAALYLDGEGRERYQFAPGEHSKLILGMMDELLREADVAVTALDALVFARGPGSFTGVRIAAGVAQGVALGAGLPVVPVSTLAILAQGAYAQHGWSQVLAALDARMGEVYWGAYRVDADGVMREHGVERVSKPDQVTAPDRAWRGAGPGWAAYSGMLANVSECDAVVYPRALHAFPMALADVRAGRAVDAEQALPVYLRDEVAWKKAR